MSRRKRGMFMMERIREFHEAFGVRRFIEMEESERADSLTLRARLISEEYEEVIAEINKHFDGEGNLADLAKELADLIVVIAGTADVLDIPLDEVYAEVMESNMSKLGPEGKPLLREDGKILKPLTYRPPNIQQYVS